MAQIDESILDDGSRFLRVRGSEAEWAFDARSLEIVPVPDGGDRGMEEALAAMPEPGPRPIRSRTLVSNLKLALSSRCPAACAYCFRDPDRESPRPRPGLIVDLLAAMVGGHGADASSYTVTFNLASEPLADVEQLEELYREAAAFEASSGKPIGVYLCTSATVQTERALYALTSPALGGRLAISVDGPPEVHDRFRRDASGGGTFSKAMRLADWGRSRGLRLEAQAVLTAAFPRPDIVLEELLALGFESVSMKPVRAGFELSFSAGDLAALLDAYDRLFARLARGVKSGDYSLIEALRGDFSMRPLWKLALGVGAESRCIWGTTHIVADAMGDYYPCDSVLGRPEHRCGSLGEGVDWERFHADLSWRAREPCPACWARRLCGGTCYASGLTIGGSLLELDPAECAINRHLARRCVELAVTSLESGAGVRALRRALLGTPR